MMTRSWHKPHHKLLKLSFHPKKMASKLKNSPYFKHKRLYINHLVWFDLEQDDLGALIQDSRPDPFTLAEYV